MEISERSFICLVRLLDSHVVTGNAHLYRGAILMVAARARALIIGLR